MKIFLFWLLIFAGSAPAADYYVTASGKGSVNGKDWSNAWGVKGIAWDSVKPGDTVWLAGGTYADTLRVKANGTAAARILIKRASAKDPAPVAAAGWQASFDSQVVFSANNPCIDLPNQSFITIDGNNPLVVSQLANNSRVYGIKCIAKQNGGYTITVGENDWSGTSYPVTDLTFTNIDSLGPYVTGPGQATAPAHGFYALAYYQPKTNMLLHDCRWQGYCESFQTTNWVNCTIEYCYIGEEPAYAELDHPDVMLNSGTSKGITLRYSIIAKSHADGIIFDPAGTGPWNFYGNVYWGSFNALVHFNSAGSSSSTFGPYLFYNNVFAAGSPKNPDFNDTIPSWVLNDGKAAATSYVQNNIFWNCGNWLVTSGVVSNHNAYNSDNTTAPVPNESNKVTFTGDPFVNSAIGDFHLKPEAASQFNKGVALPSSFNKDMDGNTRADPWTIGAFQVGSGGPTPAPTPTPPPTPAPTPKFKVGDAISITAPTNVRATPGGALLGEQPTGATGIIKDGPQDAPLNGPVYTWYDVNFSSPPKGWSGDSSLIPVSPTPAPSPTPTPAPTPAPTPPAGGPTYTKWADEFNKAQADWVKAHPPQPD